MENVSFSQSMMFRKSWDFMKKQGVTMVGLYLAFMVVSVFLSLISGENVTSGRYILGNLLAAILSWGFGMGFGKLILNILDGMEPKMSVFLSIWSRIMIRISFAGIIILDTELGCRAALKRSWYITKGYEWKLILLYLSILLLNVLGLLALVIGVFFTIVMSSFISTIAYRVLWALYRENENIMDEVSAVDYDK